MASKTQGTALSIETALASTKAITGITNANPAVATIVGNGYSDGDIIKITDVEGMVQLNNRAFIVASAATDSVTLKGIDSTNYSTYTSGGNSYKATMTAIGTVTGVTGFDGTAPDIKTTHLLSTAEEKLQGLQDFGNITLDILLDNADSGQAEMRAAKTAQASKVFTILATDTKKACFLGFVKSFTFASPGNDVYKVTSQVSIQAEPAWFA